MSTDRGNILKFAIIPSVEYQMDVKENNVVLT